MTTAESKTVATSRDWSYLQHISLRARIEVGKILSRLPPEAAPEVRAAFATWIPKEDMLCAALTLTKVVRGWLARAVARRMRVLAAEALSFGFLRKDGKGDICRLNAARKIAKEVEEQVQEARSKDKGWQHPQRRSKMCATRSTKEPWGKRALSGSADAQLPKREEVRVPHSQLQRHLTHNLAAVPPLHLHTTPLHSTPLHSTPHHLPATT